MAAADARCRNQNAGAAGGVESHLRDEIERQIKSGLSEPIAFEVSVKQVGQPQSLRNEFQKVERNIMKRYTSSRFLGSYIIAGILLSFIMQATVELLRHDYNPLRNLLNEYLVGPFSFLEMAVACMFAATFSHSPGRTSAQRPSLRLSHGIVRSIRCGGCLPVCDRCVSQRRKAA